MQIAKSVIDVRRYQTADKAEWDSLVARSKNFHFMFFRDYMDYHADRFQDHSLLFYQNGKLLALLPCSEHDSELRSHGGLTYGGFLCDDSMKQAKMLECFRVLKHYLLVHGFKFLLYKCIPAIYHRIPAEEDRYALFRNQAELVKIEPSTTIVLRERTELRKGRKANVRRARREGIFSSESMDLKSFFKLEAEVLESRHNLRPIHTAEEMQLLQSRFPENIKLYVVEKGNRLLAGALIYLTPQTVHTQYLAVNEEGRRIGVLDLLLVELIEFYRNSKQYFDFGISSESGGLFLNEGLISQKEGFGGRTMVYETWKLYAEEGAL